METVEILIVLDKIFLDKEQQAEPNSASYWPPWRFLALSTSPPKLGQVAAIVNTQTIFRLLSGYVCVLWHLSFHENRKTLFEVIHSSRKTLWFIQCSFSVHQIDRHYETIFWVISPCPKKAPSMPLLWLSKVACSMLIADANLRIVLAFQILMSVRFLVPPAIKAGYVMGVICDQ